MSGPLSEERLQELKRRMLEEHRYLAERMRNNDHYQLSATLRESLDELSTYDNHPGDQGTETFERSKDLALLERDGFRMSRIKKALERIESGEYGICRECGKFISWERLEAMPTAEFCVEHEPRQLESLRRPIEETRLWKPWGHGDEDDSDFTGFDSEDAWQVVAQWGTSNTPAMSGNRYAKEYDFVHSDAADNEGVVESLESFLATDITGRRRYVVRNFEYFEYLNNGEGEALLEPDDNLEDRL